jgi:hypothetical protein
MHYTASAWLRALYVAALAQLLAFGVWCSRPACDCLHASVCLCFAADAGSASHGRQRLHEQPQPTVADDRCANNCTYKQLQSSGLAGRACTLLLCQSVHKNMQLQAIPEAKQQESAQLQQLR